MTYKWNNLYVTVIVFSLHNFAGKMVRDILGCEVHLTGMDGGGEMMPKYLSYTCNFFCWLYKKDSLENARPADMMHFSPFFVFADSARKLPQEMPTLFAH